jgi:hypothetical protein
MLVTIGEIVLAIILVYRDCGLSTFNLSFFSRFSNPF